MPCLDQQKLRMIRRLQATPEVRIRTKPRISACHPPTQCWLHYRAQSLSQSLDLAWGLLPQKCVWNVSPFLSSSANIQFRLMISGLDSHNSLLTSLPNFRLFPSNLSSTESQIIFIKEKGEQSSSFYSFKIPGAHPFPTKSSPNSSTDVNGPSPTVPSGLSSSPPTPSSITHLRTHQ